MHAISHLLLHSLVRVRLVALVGPLFEAVLLVAIVGPLYDHIAQYNEIFQVTRPRWLAPGGSPQVTRP